MRSKLIFEVFQLFKDGSGTAKHLLALRCQAHIATVPDQQRQPEMPFQLLDFAAYSALGQAQPLRSQSKATGIGNLYQCLHGLKIGHVANFIHAFYE